ncbi:MAG: hypothetical protein II186_08800 [Erysipelotrichales bacterium]|nr:hypothetical protein [Erysipelotrichales bacterium]
MKKTGLSAMIVLLVIALVMVSGCGPKEKDPIEGLAAKYAENNANGENLYISEDGTTLYYGKDGKSDLTFTGMVEFPEDGLLYIENGIWKEDFTGIYRPSNGEAGYYVAYGVFSEKDGLRLLPDGSVALLKKGRTWDEKRLYENTDDGHHYYMKDGIWQSDYTGLYESSTGVVYYIVNGYLSRETCLADDGQGRMVYIENGIMKKDYTGTYTDPDGNVWNIKDGVMVPDKA